MATPLTKGSLSGSYRYFDWRDVDWSQTDEQISERYGPLPSTVAAMRLRHGPTLGPAGFMAPTVPAWEPTAERPELVALRRWLTEAGHAHAARSVRVAEVSGHFGERSVNPADCDAFDALAIAMVRVRAGAVPHDGLDCLEDDIRALQSVIRAARP